MNRRTFWKSAISFALCFALVAPFLTVSARAQDGNAKLIARLQNRQKLQLEGKKFEAAVNKLKPLAAKTTFTAQDLDTVDAFIAETDDGEQIAVRAQSKAFAAAQSVKAFEDGVKAAAKGKDPKEFIAALEDDPQAVYKIAGAREASQAFTNSVKSDAAVLKTLGEKLKAQGKKPISQNYLDAAPSFGFMKASFVKNENFGCSTTAAAETSSDTDLDAFAVRGAKSMPIPGAIEAALIALAVAYLGVQAARLANGQIGACVDRAVNQYNRCIRNERRDGSGLTLAERAFCRGEFLIDVNICIILPI